MFSDPKRWARLVLSLVAVAATIRTGAVHAAGDEPAVATLEPAAAPALPLTSAVVYEINLRAFSDTGDLPGATARLDQLEALGVNVVWLMPIHPVGQERSVGDLGSPYSVRDYTAVNPEFGTADDLDAFVAAAHRRGIRVILDWVANHTAWDHAWTQNDGWHTRGNDGEIVHPEGTNWLDVADLDFESDAMRAAMIAAMAFWVREHSIDGFRCDFADGVPADFWTDAISTLEAVAGRELFMLAEGGKPELYDAGFDLTYGWGFYHRLKQVYAGEAPAVSLADEHEREYREAPAGKHLLRFTTNHDETAWDDTPVALFGGEDGAFGAFVLAATYGGVPLIYNGQEIGWADKTAFFDRDPIDWDHPNTSAERYARLLEAKADNPALRDGTTEDFSSRDITAFLREHGDDAVLVLVNTRDREVSFRLPVDLRGRRGTDVLSGRVTTFGASLDLKAHASFVWVLDQP